VPRVNEAVTAAERGPHLLAGRYRVDGLLGRGGISDVDFGYDERLDRRVAIKVLRQYSLGCLLCELLTGDQPFFGTESMPLRAHHPQTAPPSVRARRPGVPEAISLLEDATGRAPDAAYALELRRALAAALFYAGEYTRAATLFDAVASDYRHSGWLSHSRARGAVLSVACCILNRDRC
jgi:serine/threonine protein kinase